MNAIAPSFVCDVNLNSRCLWPVMNLIQRKLFGSNPKYFGIPGLSMRIPIQLDCYIHSCRPPLTVLVFLTGTPLRASWNKAVTQQPRSYCKTIGFTQHLHGSLNKQQVVALHAGRWGVCVSSLAQVSSKEAPKRFSMCPLSMYQWSVYTYRTCHKMRHKRRTFGVV